MEDVIRAVFASFDKKGQGYIDINNLREISKELGREMDQSELEECLKDLDVNKDDKITYKEFMRWWLSGRQGLSHWMRQLLAFKLKTTKFIGQISGPLKDILKDQEESGAHDAEIQVNSLSVNLNRVKHAGTTIVTKLLFLSPELR